MSSITVEAMLESFPNNPVTKIEGEPSYQALRTLETELIQNASSIFTELGGGGHGYLGLLLSSAKHLEITGHDFSRHPNPGPIPTFPANPTQPQIAQMNATHKDQLRLHREQQTLIKALKNNSQQRCLQNSLRNCVIPTLASTTRPYVKYWIIYLKISAKCLKEM